MNNQMIQNNWSDIKAKIAAKWSQFNDTELEGFRGNLDKLSAALQKTYGVAKEQAEKEYGDFKISLQSITETAKANITPVLQSVMVSEGAPVAPVKKAV